MDANDAILLEGMQFYAFHGANPEEQVLGQRFLVDVELNLDLRPGGRSDELSKTVSYSTVYRRVRDIVGGPPRNLIEAVAEDIATALLGEYEADRVIVTVRKPAVPIRDAMLDAAGVRIVRTRAELESETQNADVSD